MSLTYGLRSVADLFAKLKRDEHLLNEEITSDRFFNFVVTGYSIIDWIKKDPSVPLPAKSKDVINDLYGNKWLSICKDLANASKHFTLTKANTQVTSTSSEQGFGIGRFSYGGFGLGEESILIELSDGSRVFCLDFVTAVCKFWDEFLSSHKIV